MGPDDFRARFLRKLAHSRAWVPAAQRPPKHQTVIIFDWDDTLLCTTWLVSQQDVPLPSAAEQQLRRIAAKARELLEAAVRLGRHTFIITNAMTGWVEHSAATWVPELVPTLRKVRIVSARDQFEPFYPEDVGQWKIQAFLEVQRQLDCTLITNLIAIGDSTFEMDAAKVMGAEIEEAVTKTIKFQHKPTPLELLKQMELVAERFNQIVTAASNLKIFFERH